LTLITLPEVAKKMNLPIAITMGDAAGIGPEIIAKLYQNQSGVTRGTFVAGDVLTMRRASALVAKVEGTVPLPVVQMQSVNEAFVCPAKCIPVYQVGKALEVVAPGEVSAKAGEFSGRCILWAAHAALRGELSAIVTAPIHKEALHAAGEPYAHFPGHTEMLQSAAAAYLKIPVEQLPVRMMLANNELRVVLVSIHVSLLQAIEAVTIENVLQTIAITHASLMGIMGRAPRIAVAGLNPHAGEGGLFGREELDVIAPAIALAREWGCDAMGPLAPDTVFMRARRGVAGKVDEFDAVVAMYHDQGLIPVKYLGVDTGVNVTLGLPLIRTSPDHGTAFDIAGKGLADPASLTEALRVAKTLITS
jgi:4-hydroxythreonine-4-phosphate dehydrogenase